MVIYDQELQDDVEQRRVQRRVSVANKCLDALADGCRYMQGTDVSRVLYDMARNLCRAGAGWHMEPPLETPLDADVEEMTIGERILRVRELIRDGLVRDPQKRAELAALCANLYFVRF